LEKDKEVLFNFYDFPAQHWRIYGLPTLSNQPSLPSGCEPTEPRVAVHESRQLTMVFKLGLEAQKLWRRLQGFELIPKVVTGVRFVDGEEQTQQAA
jgi:putative transposase